MNLPPLAAIRAFEAAARLESFARAAQELGTSAAAISQHVRLLEAWLGQRLFERKPRGVVLTAQGRELGADVSRGLGVIAGAMQRAQMASKGRGVSLACLPSIATHWLGPRLTRFRAAHPDIQVSIRYSAGATRADEADADLLIFHGPTPQRHARRILSGETRAAASPAFIAAHGPFRQPRDLLSAELLHDETTQSWQRWFEAADVNATVKAGPIFADFNLLLGSLLAGLGVGLCPIALIRQELQTGRLVLLFDHATDTDKGYWLVERDNPSPDAVIMRDWLITQAKAG